MPTIRENLVRAKEILAQIPEENTNLGAWYYRYKGDTPDCGTIACAAGWLALQPEFNAQGLRKSTSAACIFVDGGDGRTEDLDRLFGANAFDRIFQTYGYSSYDKEILHCKGEDINHKELALARINRAIFDLDNNADNS